VVQRIVHFAHQAELPVGVAFLSDWWKRQSWLRLAARSAASMALAMRLEMGALFVVDAKGDLHVDLALAKDQLGLDQARQPSI
jgi:uncharacterized protein YaeQ